jgi:hypothetical protein
MLAGEEDVGTGGLAAKRAANSDLFILDREIKYAPTKTNGRTQPGKINTTMFNDQMIPPRFDNGIVYIVAKFVLALQLLPSLWR